MLRKQRGEITRWIGLLVLVLFGLGLPACTSVENQGTEGTAVATAAAATVTATSTAAEAEDVSAAGWLMSQLVEASVIAPDDSTLGRAAALVIDSASGQVGYVVVAGDNTADLPRLVPWSMFDLAAVQVEGKKNPGMQFRARFQAEDLTNAPGFDPGVFVQQDAEISGWDRDHLSYWRDRAQALQLDLVEPDRESPVLLDRDRLRQIDDVFDANDERVGELEDLIIDSSGAVQFALMEPDQALVGSGAARELVVVSWRVLRLLSERSGFRLVPSPERLSQAPRVDPASLPDLSLPGWEQTWSAYWRQAETAQPTQTAAAVLPPEAPAGYDMLLGSTLLSVDGDSLGIVEDWLMDAKGTPLFLAVTAPIQSGEQIDAADHPAEPRTPRTFNTGADWIIVPWNITAWDPVNAVVTFREQAAVFSGAPAYADSGMVDDVTSWMDTVRAYWQTFVDLPGKSEAAANQETMMFWASDILDSEIVGIEKTAVGKGAGLIMDQTGALRYLILDESGRYKAVPWSYFDLLVAGDGAEISLIYTDDPEQLQQAPTFDTLEQALRLDAAADQELQSYWGMR